MNQDRVESRSPAPRLSLFQPDEQVGVRGCLELILKIIIGLMIVAWFVSYWMRQRDEMSIWIIVGAILLILLLIWLIIRQGHFCLLRCQLTEPTGCKHGDPNILSGSVLEPIVGSAYGWGFSHYELQILWNGVNIIPNAVVYADNAGNPDTAATQGNHQVNSGTLGFVDVQQAALGAGLDILTSTDFEVRLYVRCRFGGPKLCWIAFSITAARNYIKTIGGAQADDVIDPSEILRRGSSEQAVGGRLSVRGASDAYGCNNEVISTYSLWIKDDPGGATVIQPPNHAPYDPATDGWTNLTSVTFTTSQQRSFNTLDGMPVPSWLTNRSTWGTREICTWIDMLPPFCFNVPDLTEFRWESRPQSGRFAFLLKMEDTGGNLYYDIQRSWIDNRTIRGRIEGPAGIGPCQDVYILDIPNGILEITGYATDPLIVPSDPTTTPTNDNFREYTVAFRKQGAAGDFPLDIPLATGNLPALSPTTPVPTRAVWTGAAADPPDPPIAVLAEWQLDWLTGANAAVPPDQLLAPGESCPYDIVLEVWDRTWVDEWHTHWTGRLTFPIKVHNASASGP